MSHLTYMKKQTRNLKPTNKKNIAKVNPYLWILPLVIVSAFAVYSIYFAPKKVDIFAIDDTSIQYGEIKVVGTVIKDSPIEKDGNYLLVLSSMKTILLSSDNLDPMLGKTVSVSGMLTPSLNTTYPDLLLVNEIIVIE